MRAFTQSPTHRPNPHPRAPLAAVLSFTTKVPVSGQIEIQDGKRKWTIAIPFDSALERQLPVAGIRAGKPNRLVDAHRG